MNSLEESYLEVLQQILKFLVCHLQWMILNLMFHHLLQFTTISTETLEDPIRSNLKHLNKRHNVELQNKSSVILDVVCFLANRSSHN